MLSLITLRQKLLIATIALSIPILYLGYLMVSENLTIIEKRQLELNGLEYQAYLRPISKSIAEHRGLTSSYLNGNETVKSNIDLSAKNADQAIAKLIEFDKQWNNQFNTKELIDVLSQTWNELKSENLNQRKRENFIAHSSLIKQALFIADHIAVNTALTLDPDPDISYLSNLTTILIPKLNEEVGKLRGVSTAIATRQYLEDGENLTVLSYQIGVRETQDATKKLFNRAFKENAVFEADMKESLTSFSESIDVVLDNSQFLVTDITGLMQAESEEYFSAGTVAIEKGEKLNTQVIQTIKSLLNERISAMKSKLYFSAGISLALFIFACFFNYIFAREVNNNFSRVIKLFERIKGGKYDSEIVSKGNTEFSKIFSSLSSMQEGLKDSVQRDRELAEESGRINMALGMVSAGVMMVDEDLNIIYTNPSVIDILGAAEEDIRKDLPNFDSKNLMGANIDMFHKDPSHQRGLLANLKDTHNAEISVGGRTLVINANPVFNQDNVKIGTVVEWSDRTQELTVINEVQSLVENASMGNLSERIDLSNKEGFYKRLSSGMNDLIDVSERVINDTLRVLGAMSQGKLNETIDEDYQGVYEQLKTDTNLVIDKLKDVVTNIKTSSDTVGTAAQEISQGNNNLSQRTEEQAASLEETSSSMEEMTSTVQQNADNAQQANQLAISAREQAENGGQVVTTAINAMDEINTSSKKIADIISVIDEIAFQTNLLALNASVEAARAGEQGRGFAVVASEVRNLAGRSATAAKEIKELIEDSVVKVSEGSKLVNKSGETLDEIVNSVKKVTDIIAEISASSQEQASGIDEVNKAILQMDENTQQNAALVEQAAAASQSMNQEAEELTKQIGFFSVGNNVSPSTTQAKTINNEVTIDRRSADRPWNDASSQVSSESSNELSVELNSESSGKSSSKPEDPNVIVDNAVGSDLQDQEWQEF